MNETITTGVNETIAFGRSFARSLQRGDVVALVGELGSGKTQFVKGVCEGLQVRTPVTSPTFVVLNRYEGRDETGTELLVYHLDLYRIRSAQELYDLGYEEILNGDGVSLIEWAECLGPLMPEKRKEVSLSYGTEETTRCIRITEYPGVLA
jgi:tRNA threonylcarbamoyladenosine biosynthesis protein TsaE